MGDSLRASCFAIAALMLAGCASFHKGNFFGDREPPKHGQFKHVKFVYGSASATYYLGLAASRSDLYSQAHQQMVQSAELEGTNRQLVNMTVETYSSFFLLALTKTVTVTAEVIEVTAPAAPAAAVVE
jgi:hypothetical protein